MINRVRISRRTALRGMGAQVALPLLEAMTPESAATEAASSKSLRMAFIYVPNGVNLRNWTPRAVGANVPLPPILQPLKEVQGDLLVLSGLTLDKARAHGDGGGDHARAMATFLTGSHPHKTNGASLRAGVSVDQLAARKLGRATRFASLEIGCEGGKSAGACDHGYSCAYQTNLSWRSESTPAAKEINPQLVFERLFGTGRPDGRQANRERDNKSILDVVAEDARQLRGKLGGADRRKLDEYLTGVREVESRLTRSGTETVHGVKFPRPAGIPASYEEHLRLMSDLLVLAFQCDLTRIATFVHANDGSNRSYRELGAPEGHHDLSHHGNEKAKLEKIEKINTFHVAQFAYLLKKLKGVKEGNGTLLDNCMIIYGSGISDGDRHNHDDLPILLAGKAGGAVKTGRHIRYRQETPLCNLHLSLLDLMGVRLAAFGDSSGRLPALSG